MTINITSKRHLDESVLYMSLTSKESLIQLEPFILNLPNGEHIWRYVLVGDNRTELDQDNTLLNLDSVIINIHAKHFAPDFFTQIVKRVGFGGFASQIDIARELADVMRQCRHDLQTCSEIDDAQRDLFAQCYLRILDVFYHLLDQKTLCDSLYQELVEKKATKLLTKEQFYQRYSQEAYPEAGELSARSIKQISEYIASLDGGTRRVNQEALDKIERVFAENRLSYDCAHWDDDKPAGNVVVASYLLSRDAKEQLSDKYTLQLKKLVNDVFISIVKSAFSYGSTTNKSVFPEALCQWLNGDQDSIPKSLLALAYQDLSVNDMYIGTGKGSPLGDHQPDYVILKSNHDFRDVLTASYWLIDTDDFPFANRIIQFSLTLDPQRTLSLLGQIHRESRFDNEFASVDLHETFLMKMVSRAQIRESQVVAFNVYYAQKYDQDTYKLLMKKYNNKTKAVWDQGISELIACSAQQFYLDVCRFGNFDATSMLGVQSDILHELLRRNIKLISMSLASHFNDKDFLFNDYRFELPNRLHTKSVEEDPEIISKLDNQLTVLQAQEKGKSYRMLMKPTKELGGAFVTVGGVSSQELVIFKKNVSKEDISTHIVSLKSTEEMEVEVIRIANRYLASEITYAEYQQRVKSLADFSSYHWVQEDMEKRANLLPFLLTEKDNEKKYRIIKLFCIEGEYGASFEKIAFELFLEQDLLAGNLDLQDRLEWTIDDVEDETMELFIPFKEELANQLAAID